MYSRPSSADASARVVLYAEDPGAANFIAALAEPLRALGFDPLLVAESAAAPQLRALCAEYEVPEKLENLVRGCAALVVGTSENRDSAAHRLVGAARAAGVPSLGVVDAPSHPAERFRGSGDTPLACAPDWLLVPDAATRDAFVALGHPAERAVEVGHPHYDRVLGCRPGLERTGREQLRRRHFPGVPPHSPMVVFLAELSDGLDSAEFTRCGEYTLAGWGDDDRRTHVVLQEVLDALADVNPAPSLVLRLHPKNDVQEFGRYLGQLAHVSRDEPALEVVYAADLVVGMTTMLMAEAALLGRPILSVLPRAVERAWLPAGVGRQVPVATRSEEITPAIRHLLGTTPTLTLPQAGAGTRAAAAIEAAVAEARAA